jgi:ribosomal protein L1
LPEESILMLRTLNAVVDEDGNVRLLEAVRLPTGRRLLVTVLADGHSEDEAALLSEASLGTDWERPEEDAAWAHLQRGR